MFGLPFKVTGAKIHGGFDDACNTIEGLRHGGMSQVYRNNFSDFGSGWNALKGLLRANETFAEMTATKGFKEALESASQVRELGTGKFATTYEMKATFRGEEFRFARKTGEIGEYEVEAMRAFEGRMAPSVYASKTGQIDMELFKGVNLSELTPAQKSKVYKAVESIETKGWAHRDYHKENIMLIDIANSSKKRIGIIDWGKAIHESVDPGEVARYKKLSADPAIRGIQTLPLRKVVEQRQEKVNTINKLNGNQAEHIFRAAKDAGKRHITK